MPSTTEQQPADVAAVESAITQVLQAEQAARAATEADAVRAGGYVELARAQARAIAERAAQRTLRVHQWADARIARQLALIAEERGRLNASGSADAGAAVGSPASDDPRLQPMVASAVARLAAQLTGETS